MQQMESMASLLRAKLDSEGDAEAPSAKSKIKFVQGWEEGDVRPWWCQIRGSLRRPGDDAEFLPPLC